MRTTTIGLCALLLTAAFTASYASAETLENDELITIATEVVGEEGGDWNDARHVLANGSWECHCYCDPINSIYVLGAEAEIPGKCDDTEGDACSGTFMTQDGSSKRDFGLLSDCGNVFVISSSP